MRRTHGINITTGEMIMNRTARRRKHKRIIRMFGKTTSFYGMLSKRERLSGNDLDLRGSEYGISRDRRKDKSYRKLMIDILRGRGGK